VTSDGLTSIEDFQHMSGNAYINTLADQAIWNRVIPTLELDVVVEKDLGSLPAGILITRSRSRTPIPIVT
jgi:hypothetical protein